MYWLHRLGLHLATVVTLLLWRCAVSFRVSVISSSRELVHALQHWAHRDCRTEKPPRAAADHDCGVCVFTTGWKIDSWFIDQLKVSIRQIKYLQKRRLNGSPVCTYASTLAHEKTCMWLFSCSSLSWKPLNKAKAPRLSFCCAQFASCIVLSDCLSN